MISKFKVGDKVEIIGSLTEAGKAKIGQGGEILDIDWENGTCFVLFPKGQDWVREADLALVTSAPADKKREFLEKLQSLLREFDAKIQVYAGEDGDCGIGFYIGEPEENHIWYTNEWGGNKFDFPITADNIMDFD